MVKPNLNINQILRKAKEEGEIFLVSLSSRELEKTGFSPIWGTEKEFFESFDYVDIYLIYTGKELLVTACSNVLYAVTKYENY